MPDGFAYCETLVREEDKERYLAALFAPADARGALLSLYAFDLETVRVAQRVHEPLAGEIRLQWWRDALAGEADEQAAGHPVAAAFRQTTLQYDLPREPLLRLLDARRERLYEEQVTGPEALGGFARATAGTVLGLAGHILNGGPDPRIGHLAETAALAALVGAETGAHRHADAALAAARDSLARTQALIDTVPERALPAFLPLALARARLQRMERGMTPDIPQWRKQWILWRASKNLVAWL
jgi:phytoene synthase